MQQNEPMKKYRNTYFKALSASLESNISYIDMMHRKRDQEGEKEDPRLVNWELFFTARSVTSGEIWEMTDWSSERE